MHAVMVSKDNEEVVQFRRPNSKLEDFENKLKTFRAEKETLLNYKIVSENQDGSFLISKASEFERNLDELKIDFKFHPVSIVQATSLRQCYLLNDENVVIAESSYQRDCCSGDQLLLSFLFVLNWSYTN